MTTQWGSLTIGATPVRISAVYLPCCKISFQSAPGNTGNVKIGGAGLTSDNATPGIFLAATAATNPDTSKLAGSLWSVESQTDGNTLDASQYYVHGTHAGDVVMFETHQE